MAKKRGSDGPTVIEGATLARIKHDGVSPPCAVYMGGAADPGDVIRIRLSNKVVYEGTVSESIEAGGEVFTEFVNGITPVK
jgi:hypothetical protein